VAQVGELSARELDMWMIRASTEPFLARRLELYLAQICMWLHNVNSKKGKPLQDFLLFQPKKPLQLDDDVDQKARDVMGKLTNMNVKAK